MQEIDWGDAIDLAFETREDAGGALKAIADLSARLAIGRRPCLVDYSYGDFIFSNGRLRWPGGQAPDPAYVSETGTCLGLILRNACEVQERGQPPLGDTRIVRAPEALLPPGRWLGLFELLDDRYGLPAFASPDWSITAGSISVFGLASHESRDVEQARRAAFGVNEAIRGATLFQAIAPVMRSSKTAGTEWRVRVLFLPASSLARFKEEIAQSSPLHAAQLAYLRLGDQAWPNVASMRQNAVHELTSLILKTDAAATRNRTRKALMGEAAAVRAAARLAAYVLNAGLGACVAYAATDQDDECGPFATISSVLEECDLPAAVLRPAYLKEGDSGFYRLADLDPVFFCHHPEAEDFETRLTAVAKLLHDCMLCADKNLTNHVAQHRRAFEAMHYRIPPAKTGRLSRADVSEAYRNAHREAITMRHAFNEYGDKLTLATKDDFLDGGLKGAPAPTPRTPFFRAAIRVGRPGPPAT